MAGAWGRAGPPLSRSPIRIGLLGGSFNPAHGGHRRISLFAAKALGLDEVWWLVSPGNPLKDAATMAPLTARVASATAMARLAPIRVSAIERELGTRFTVDTLAKIRRRWPKIQFIWLMGADNLAQFHRWHRWRDIARAMPIAILARPRYDGAAIASPAMAWLGRYRQSSARCNGRQGWSAPRLVFLKVDPDPRSASAIRQADPGWSGRYGACTLRDGLTRRPLALGAISTAPCLGLAR